MKANSTHTFNSWQLALLLSIVLNILLTFAKAIIPALQHALESMFLNAWLGQLIFVTVCFLIVGKTSLKISGQKTSFRKLLAWMLISAVILLFGFFAF